MSLDCDLTKIKDYETLCWRQPEPGEIEANDHTMFGRMVTEDGRIQNPVTHALIFGCMSIGIGEITEQNYEEWFIRYRSLSFLYPDHPDPITLEDVKAHIGLTTNVFPKRSKREFAEQIRTTLEDRVRRELRQVQEMVAQ